MVDLYGNGPRYEAAKKSMEDWDIPVENKEAINNYLEEQIDRLSPGGRYSTFCFLKRIFYGKTQGGEGDLVKQAFVQKSISKMTLAQWRAVNKKILAEGFAKDTYHKITNHLRRVYEQAFEQSTKKTHLEILNIFNRTGRRAFFQYKSDDQDNMSLTKENFYSFDEFKEILRTARRPQERAILVTAWETTSRPNEYLSLNVGDVEEIPNGFKLKAHISKKKDGKTETRNLYIINFRAEFADFWNRHPFKDKPQAPLFYREDNKVFFGQRIGPAGTNKMLKTLDYRSGVKRKGTLYYLRHGGYTWKVAQNMNPALAGKDMGWVPGSKQARRYEHLKDDDLLKERFRLADEHFEKEVKPKIRVRICPFCNQQNSPVDERCTSCGQTLSMEEVTKQLNEERAARKRMERDLDRFKQDLDSKLQNMLANVSRAKSQVAQQKK